MTRRRAAAGLAALACLVGALALLGVLPALPSWVPSVPVLRRNKGTEPDRAVAAARTLANDRRWDEVLTALGATEGADAAALRADAMIESRNARIFQDVQRRAVDGDAAGARAAAVAIPVQSVYRPDADRILRALP